MPTFRIVPIGILVLVGLLLSPAGFAGPILREEPLPQPVSVEYDRLGYLEPNENHPENGNPIFSEGNGGTYVSVGSERGFIGAALSNSDRLVLIDRDPTVVRFNRINAVLLLVAKNREDYVRLRAVADPQEWLNRANSLPEGHPGRDLLNQLNWEWWKNNVRTNQRAARGGDWNFDLFHGLTNETLRGRFQGVNYTVEDHLFSRLQNLARNQRIESHLIDLTDVVPMKKLATAFSSAKTKVSFLDLSNTWGRAYLESDGVVKVMRYFTGSIAPDSILLLTGPGKLGWSYNGFTTKYLLSSTNPARVLKETYATAVKLPPILTFNGILIPEAKDEAGRCIQKVFIKNLKTL